MSDTPKLDPPELDQVVDIVYRHKEQISQLQRELAEAKAFLKDAADSALNQRERAEKAEAALRQAGEALGKFFDPKHCYHCLGSGVLQRRCPNCEERRTLDGCCRCGGAKTLAAYLSVASTPDERRALYDGLRTAHAAIAALLEPLGEGTNEQGKGS